MKLHASSLLLAIPLLMGSRETRHLVRESCEIVTIYRPVETPVGAVSLSLSGLIEEIETLLVPRQLSAGEYGVTATRRSPTLYEVNRGTLFVVTQYCYHSARREPAVLRIGDGMFARSTIVWE